ncbi:uncharacterized protein LOC105186192 [Harpegnathos saltator]|uniref:uncharacterized protein LOC105186192 n=1 Tax=Harpegnathos saltator TaxID=610380 RepID=UPI0005911BA3|nr:uncharacterized protein LOC105186192 [Harpegnathos saltator]
MILTSDTLSIDGRPPLRASSDRSRNRSIEGSSASYNPLSDEDPDYHGSSSERERQSPVGTASTGEAVPGKATTTSTTVAATKTGVSTTTTTASTTSKACAGVKTHTSTALAKRRREFTSVSSISSIEVDSKPSTSTPVLIQKRDPRGRPATTGNGVGLKHIWAEKAARKKEKANCLESEVEDLSDTISKELLREAGSTELASEAGRAIDAVRLVARRSNTLKGTFVSLLNRATAASEAVMSTLIARVAAQEGRKEAITKVRKEMEGLREEMKALRVENRRFLEELMRPSRPPSAPSLFSLLRHPP